MRRLRAIFRLKTPTGIEQHIGPWFLASNWAMWGPNYSYMSPHDGEIWCKLLWDGKEDVKYPQLFYSVQCSSIDAPRPWHSSDVPGSLLQDIRFIHILPYELLVREFNLRCERYLNAPKRQEAIEQQADINPFDFAPQQEEAQLSVSPHLVIAGIQAAV